MRHGPVVTGSPGYRCARPRDEPITAAPIPAIARYDSRSFADQQHRSYSRKEGDSVAGKKERQRKLARERYQRQQARRVQRTQRWRRIGIIVAACCAVIALGAGSYVALSGGGNKTAAATATPHPTASPTATPTPTASPTPTLAAEPASHCTYTPSGTAARKVGVPSARPAFKGAKYQATVKTNRGTIVLDLLNHQATCTVNSFIYLAGKKYFNNTPCHRLTTTGIYVLQCGDPTGTGSGGPGYKFADENLTGAKYTEGTLAMANAGPGTNGSQFFLVYRNSTTLPPNYTPFGKIVSGLGIIQNVAKAGTDNSNGNGDGHPKEKVTIQSVTITKA
jgi:peptidyl-prolyl cis-trans isomerase B (cyclophilin B)